MGREEQTRLVQRLAETPLIMSDMVGGGQTFVRPRQLVVSLYEDDQIHPYLTTMPTELGEFKRLFLQVWLCCSSAKLLGIYIQSNFSCDIHFNHIMTVSSQRLHILKVLKRQGLSLEMLHNVFML